uniref:THAP-type domain-containing protein n=1 Tax=Anopheles epiroticus TaxID=199890 RepID=A0A182P947_9DIPT
MPASCVIPDCDLKYTHSDDVSFHKFPLKSPELLKQWIQFTARDENWHPTKWSAICSRHFVANDFKGCASRKILLPTAVPSIRNTVPTGSKVQSNSLSLPVISYETVCPEEDRTSHTRNLAQYLPVELDYMSLGGTLCPVIASENVDEFGADAEGDVQLIEITCRICGVVFSRAVESLLSDIVQSEEVVRKYLPFVNLDLPNLPRKICLNCSKVVNGFSKFSESVLRAQSDLEHRFAQELHSPFTVQPDSYAGTKTKQEIVTAKPMNIKQEPMASINIKEEKIEYAINSARQKDSAPVPETNEPQPPLIMKNKAFSADSNRVYLFNNVGQDNSNGPAPTITNPTKQANRESSKNCEILEIVNLYPPIVDITSATVTEVQPYEITIPSVTTATAPSESFSSFQATSSAYSAQFASSLKVENTAELDTEQEDYYLPEKLVYLNTLEEHSYTKLPIQADDNKDEVFHDMMAIGSSGQWYETVDTPTAATHKNEPKLARNVLPNWQCPICERRFTRQRRMLCHRAWECNGRKKLSVDCRFCRRKFCSWVRARAHVCLCAKRAAKHRQYKWRAILERMKSRPTTTEKEHAEGVVSDRGEIVMTKYPCSMCDRAYSNASNLRRHLTTHRPPDQWNHKCGVCFKIFDKLFDLKRHLQIASCANGAADTPSNNNELGDETVKLPETDLPTAEQVISPITAAPVDRLLMRSSSIRRRSSCSCRISSWNLFVRSCCSILASKKLFAPPTPTSSTLISVRRASWPSPESEISSPARALLSMEKRGQIKLLEAAECKEEVQGGESYR